MSIKEARVKAGLTQQKMSEIFEIPKRTIENWETETRKCPVYVQKLIVEKLEEMIMMNGKKALDKANEINEYNEIPQLEIGDIVTLADVWDGEVDYPEYPEHPHYRYSYLLTRDGEDGESNIDVYIDYEFDIIEEKEERLDSVIKITNIELV